MLHLDKTLSIKWRLAVFICFLLLLLIGSGYAGLEGMRKSNHSLSMVYQNQIIPLERLRDIETLLQVDLVGTVERVLNEKISSESGLVLVEKAQADLRLKWDEVLAAKGNDISTEERAWLDAARPLMAASNKMIAELAAVVKTRQLERLDDFASDKLYPMVEEFKAKLGSLVQDRIAAIGTTYEQAQQHYYSSRMAFIATICIGILVSLVASYFLINSINKPLAQITKVMERMMQGDLSGRIEQQRQDELGILIDGFNKMISYLAELVSQIQLSGIQVSSSVTEIAATIKQQGHMVNEHAATTNEIAASTSQIAATSANLMETMKNMTVLAKDTARSAVDGHAGLSNIDKTMVRMENATGAIVTKLSILNEKASNIAGMVKTINKVADQTNLLSLNAAIEAEKAGEYGAGFAVVATEIRRLADQTAVATYDIEQMVQDVQSAVAAGVMGIDKFAEDVRRSVTEIRQSGQQLAQVIDQVQALIPQVESINEGIEAQSLGARQISEATSQLNEAAQQTAESMAQTGTTIFQLNKAALILQDGVSRFKVEADSGHASSVI